MSVRRAWSLIALLGMIHLGLDILVYLSALWTLPVMGVITRNINCTIEDVGDMTDIALQIDECGKQLFAFEVVNFTGFKPLVLTL